MLKTPHSYRTAATYLIPLLTLVLLSTFQVRSGISSNLDRGDAQSNTQTLPPSQKSDGQGKDDAVVKQTTDVVTLSVTVTDRNDRLVTGLDRQHFEVFEGRIKQNIEYFNYEDVPVSVGIVFDI